MTPDEDRRVKLRVFGGSIAIAIMTATALICGTALIEHEDPWHVLASLMPW